MESSKLSLLRIAIRFVLLASDQTTACDDHEVQTFIVHVQPPHEKNHVFDTADDRTAWYRSFLPDDGRLVHSYHHVASGFAARLTRRELDAMSGTPEFLSAEPNEVYQLLTTHTPRFLGLDVPTSTTRNHSVSGLGDGVIIGVIDTGVFPYHSSYSGAGMPSPPARWKGRCDFFNASACNNKLIGARLICSVLGQGHGTASGMAPRAHVAMYKVCGDECTAADVLAGVDAAVGDGSDVLSISLAAGGPGVPFHKTSLMVGTFGAVEKGVFVSIGLLPAGFCGNGSLDGLDVKGKIVLCDRGNGVGRIDKGAEVKRAGGVGMIMANEFTDGYSTLADAHVLTACHVSYAAGIVFHGTVLGTSPAPAITSFSSRGPSLHNPGILKPDITGPGVSIHAAWPFQVGPSSSSPEKNNPGQPTFNFVSGTSMSTPHLSGVAALIKSKHPDWSPAMIRSAIVTTADPVDRSGNPILNEQHLPANFFATGAGHVNPDRAVDPGLVYDMDPADYVGFLCSVYESQDVSVIARRKVDCSDVEVIRDHDLNYPSLSASFPAPASSSNAAAVARRTVRNVGKAPAVYYPYMDLPAGVAHVTPSSLRFTEANQEQSFTVTVWRGKTRAAKVLQGALRWVSDKHTVRSPISITFE
ncbi:hypothetical protein HU200_026982 [Digitaria exilis]|uniref:Uncharacterized protein n=1 Tax=Digitaria exilis TaxID=1010633 RepID=A0A835BWK6_9POAL|nr:hypothetical protein HU200_026982 [Digitaria exilis]